MVVVQGGFGMDVDLGDKVARSSFVNSDHRHRPGGHRHRLGGLTGEEMFPSVLEGLVSFRRTSVSLKKHEFSRTKQFLPQHSGLPVTCLKVTLSSVVSPAPAR